jgi:uncharacterized protein
VSANKKPAVALFGASVRGLAQSAASAGFDVFACDLFRDEDLIECCRESVKLARSDYPDGFRRVAEQWPGIPHVYCGGLENFPEIVESLASTGPLWGCSPKSLRACRSPTALQECGIKTPPVKASPEAVPTDGSWLLKPLRGSAGRGIRPWLGGEFPADYFLQEQVSGEPCSASFVALTDRTLLIGAALQFIGESWPGAPPFAYAGGIAPLELSHMEVSQLERIGEALRNRFGLLGLFGVDAVRNGEEWTFIEINPRPTSSMELFELAGKGNIFEMHYSAFSPASITPTRATCIAGKAILYASRACCLSHSLPTTDGDIRFADRPLVGTAFDIGDPLATVVATGDSAKDVKIKLKQGIVQLKRRLASIEIR